MPTDSERASQRLWRSGTSSEEVAEPSPCSESGGMHSGAALMGAETLGHPGCLSSPGCGRKSPFTKGPRTAAGPHADRDGKGLS